jgi:hypothetical protein
MKQNGTLTKNFTINNGINNIKDIGKILTWNNKKYCFNIYH